MTQPRLTSTHKRVLGSAGAVIVVVVAFALLLPKIANYRSVLEVIGTLSLPWLIALIVVAILNVATFGPPWMAALPGLELPAVDGAHADVDRAVQRRPRGRCRRYRRVVRDAARLAVRHAGGDRRASWSPASGTS